MLMNATVSPEEKIRELRRGVMRRDTIIGVLVCIILILGLLCFSFSYAFPYREHLDKVSRSLDEKSMVAALGQPHMAAQVGEFWPGGNDTPNWHPQAKRAIAWYVGRVFVHIECYQLDEDGRVVRFENLVLD